MSLGVLSGLLESSPEYGRLLKSLRGAYARVRAQVISDAAPFTLATLWSGIGSSVLVIAPRPEDARRLHEQLLVWTGDDPRVLHFPETETLPFERQVSDLYTTQRRISVLSMLLDQSSGPVMVVASSTAVSQKTMPRDAFESSSHTLGTGEDVELDDLLDRWRRMGYRLEPSADVPGLCSRRGGILDVFPVDARAPSRIELWGSEIESIRHFDPDTQRSTDLVDSVTVRPAQETLPGISDRDETQRAIASLDFTPCTDASESRILEELNLLLDGNDVEERNFYAGLFNGGTVLDYFPSHGVVAMYRPNDVEEAGRGTDERANQLRSAKQRRGELPSGFPSSHQEWREVEAGLDAIARRLDITPWGAQELTGQEAVVLPFVSAPGFAGKLDAFAEEVEELAGDGHHILAVTSVPQRLREILDEYGVKAERLESLEDIPKAGSVTVLQTSGAGLSEGFVLTVGGRKLVLLSDSEIFGVAKQRRPTRRGRAGRQALLSELSPGDYVVHVEHGIARFTGTGTSDRDEGDREYLVLEYAAGDKLYVPIDHLDRVTAYVAPLDRPPSLTRLGTMEWRRTKERVERSTREMAAELLSLYAARELADGHAVAADTPWQAEVEAAFPFEETPDQKAAIVEVKADMESGKPMDRLICGDVGYGKTEIALRAAFKSVMAGRQVAILVPTTVLAQQHYVTFSQRLAAYPMKVDVLSRFRSDREQDQVVEGIAAGQVDVCIGTHRLIQKDVRFKDLGLVIIDEEQRFGVGHKERLKQMRHEVDVLTMTATPIPRTLHLSLSGIRDMSMIETPPEERLPIKTYVSEFSDELIREAIRREIDRQGQVFFLHNRVYNIDYMAGYIRMLVPEAQVGVAHGQMPEEELERAMIDFADGKMDVLACTTIIESGLDMPNVNTLIVNRADTFGLAQLYQLRGRVGRGARRAYAYLLIPARRSITETAEKRLKTMLAATELGAGFQIAMKDLEIRGAGSVLGAQQSGHIHAVGFDLYTRLLSDAVESLRAQRSSGDTGDGLVHAGAPPEAIVPASVELDIPANIPEEYVADLPTRLSIYRRLVALGSPEDVGPLEEELRDRFGPIPWQVENLMYVVRLKLEAGRALVDSISREDRSIILRLRDEVGGARAALQRLMPVGATVGNAQIRLDLLRLEEGWEGPLVATVEKLAEFRSKVEGELGVGLEPAETA